MDLIKINVGGTQFVTSRETIQNIPNCKLASVIDSQNDYSPELGAYFFDRRPDLFNAILQAHREGQLNIPPEASVNEMLKEMEFWNIPESMLAPGCEAEMAAAIFDSKVRETVRESILGGFEKSCEIYGRGTGWSKKATWFWIMLEFPNFCLKSMLWSLLIFLLVLVSIILLMLNLDLNLRQKMPDLPSNYWENDTFVNLFSDSGAWKMFCQTTIPLKFLIPDVVINALITTDMVIRLIVCPYKIVFFKSIKIVYIFILGTFWIVLFFNLLPHVTGVMPPTFFRFVWLICLLFQLLRPLLLLRLTNTFMRLKLLLVFVTRSLPEVFSVISMLGLGTIFFASIVYVSDIIGSRFIQDVGSPWMGCWWAIITMTTVGYGDTIPVTAAGYVIGTCCAITGIIVIGLTISILGNNFSVYYKYVNLYMVKINQHSLEKSVDAPATIALKDDGGKAIELKATMA